MSNGMLSYFGALTTAGSGGGGGGETHFTIIPELTITSEAGATVTYIARLVPEDDMIVASSSSFNSSSPTKTIENLLAYDGKISISSNKAGLTFTYNNILISTSGVVPSVVPPVTNYTYVITLPDPFDSSISIIMS